MHTTSSAGATDPHLKVGLLSVRLHDARSCDDRDKRRNLPRPPLVAPLDSNGTQFIMLNPAVHFAELLSEAHSVVLVGGTLQPFQHVVSEPRVRAPSQLA